MKIVLQKLISNSGYCSRRKAEELIRNGKVMVNDEVAELGMKADENDEVLVNGNEIKKVEKKIYIALNKPVDYTCTTRKFKDEKNVLELLPRELTRNNLLHIVGRLDKNSRGLVLITNDGDFTQKMSHPSYRNEKKYIVKALCKNITEEEVVEKFKQGLYSENLKCKLFVKRIKVLKDKRYEIILEEGKKRHIREMFRAINCHVADLERVSIGKIGLGDLKSGEWKYIDV